MQIEEVLESAHILHDDKARRVLNTAPNKQSDITINEIESGVTIERLESLTVPVYQYSTQITIHGVFKDLPDDIRVNGYKSIIVNGNKSLGVKYVAIDNEKKQLLAKVSRYTKLDGRKWSFSIDSQGCQAFKAFHTANHEQDKLDCIECYKSTPDDLYIGGKRAVSLMWGGYAVIIGIGAIYQSNLWKLINSLTGISTQLEYDEEVQKQKQLDDIKSKEYDAKVAEAKAQRDQKLAEAKAKFTPQPNWQVYNGKMNKPGIYARIGSDYNGNIELYVSQVAKRGAYLCANTKSFDDMQYIPWKPTKYHKASMGNISGWLIPSESEISKPKPTPKTTTPHIAKTDNIEIRHNEKLNGIEIAFPAKPETTIIESLKSLGFRWSQYNGIWYNRHSDSLMQQVKAMLI